MLVLKEKEHLFRYRASLEVNFFRCVRARANDARIVRSRNAHCNTEVTFLYLFSLVFYIWGAFVMKELASLSKDVLESKMNIYITSEIPSG